MSFLTSPDRIYVTDGATTVFDTNRSMPHFVGQVSASLEVSYPPPVNLGLFALAVRSPQFRRIQYTDWTQDYYLGSVPSGLNLFAFGSVTSTLLAQDSLSVDNSQTTWSARDIIMGTGTYGLFPSTLVEYRSSTKSNADPGTGSSIPSDAFYNHMARSLDLFVSGTGLYLRARQASKPIATSPVIPAPYTTYTDYANAMLVARYSLNITAYIGVIV